MGARTREDQDAFPPEEQDLEEEAPEDRLLRLSERLIRGGYRPPALRGFVLDGPDGKPRPLAKPISTGSPSGRSPGPHPALDEVMFHGSHGYHRGRSRHSAARAIRAAYARGCRFVYEADIDDFFDSVDWRRSVWRSRRSWARTRSSIS